MITSGRKIHQAITELHARHGTSPSELRCVDLSPKVDHAVTLSGYASTVDIDLDRVRYAPHAFGHQLPTFLPLCFDHEPETVIGTVDHLEYDARGSLRATVTTSHPQAGRCNAFSVAAIPRDCVVQNSSSPDFFVEITKADLTELSLVPTPVNPYALVLTRTRPPPTVEFFLLVAKQVSSLTEIAKLIKPKEQAT